MCQPAEGDVKNASHIHFGASAASIPFGLQEL